MISLSYGRKQYKIMNARIGENSDRDLIAALADDYLNVYNLLPEDDIADVVKLNGYVIDGLSPDSTGICYSEKLNTYAKERVFHEDVDAFLEVCSVENVIKVLTYQKFLQGKYRVWENEEIHYYNFKYVKVSAPDEKLKVVAAFRNVDDLDAKGHKKMAELERLRSILASTEMGTWYLIVPDEGHPRLTGDMKMKELMGVSENSPITDEEMFDMLVNNINVNDRFIFESYNAQLRMGKNAECTYRWNHPIHGEVYFRCGGVRVPYANGMRFNGYHYDVTEKMIKENRSNQIVKTFARSYQFINYINLSDFTYFTYSENDIEDEHVIDLLLAGDARKSIEIGCNQRVSEEYRDAVVAFSDLSTMNERMKHNKVIACEFLDVNDEWYESSFTAAEHNDDGSLKSVLWAVRKINDEKQAEIRKQKMLEENIAANKAKTKFLQNMSHEIRTPLNAMFGFAQLLGLPDGMWTDEEKNQYNQYIFNSYNMLDMLIGDIIDIADSEHGNYRIEISDVDVNSVCRNALMSVEYRKVEEVNMYFTTDLEDNYTVRSDARRIQQVLINYLTNACKNTQKGEIHLHCSKTEHPGKLTFSVTDTGSGVPPSKADLIFNRFTKLNQHIQGSGLGLNICLLIADKLGGDVYLDKTYTNGARFVFVIDDKN